MQKKVKYNKEAIKKANKLLKKYSEPKLMYNRAIFKPVIPTADLELSIVEIPSAERKPEVNKSLLGVITERISNFWLSCRNWVWFKRLEFDIKMFEFGNALLIDNHCKKGFHQFRNNCTEWIRNGKSVKINYLRCTYCKVQQFYSIEDKQKYEQISSGKRKWIKKWFG